MTFAKQAFHLASGKVGSGVVWSIIATVGNTFATGLSAIALLLLFRFLGPSEAGQFSVLLAIGMLIAKVADLGLNAAALKAGGSHTEPQELNIINSEAKKIKGMISVITTILFVGWWWLFGKQNVSFMYVFLAWLGAISMLWYERFIFEAQARKAILATVIANALQAGVKLVVIIALVILGGISLFSSTSIFVLAPFAPVLLWPWLLSTPSLKSISAQKINAVRSKLFTIMKHTAFLAIANGVLENSDVLFVQRFLSEYETGLFAGAWRIASLFILIGYSLASVLNPRVSTYHHPQDQKSYVFKALALSGLLVGCSILLIPFLPLLVSITIGSQYQDSVPVLLPLILAAFLSLATVPLTALFYQLKTDWFFSVTAIAQLIILSIGYGVFLPEFGILAAGLTRLAAHGIAFILAFVVVLWTLFTKLHNRAEVR